MRVDGVAGTMCPALDVGALSAQHAVLAAVPGLVMAVQMFIESNIASRLTDSPGGARCPEGECWPRHGVIHLTWLAIILGTHQALWSTYLHPSL